MVEVDLDELLVFISKVKKDEISIDYEHNRVIAKVNRVDIADFYHL